MQTSAIAQTAIAKQASYQNKSAGPQTAPAFQNVLENQRNQETNASNTVSESDLPIEALALPSWYIDYIAPVTLHCGINTKYWEFVGGLTEDNYMSDEERLQVQNYLQNDPIHQEKLAQSEFRKQYRSEISEYLESMNTYFQESLQENGVSSNRDYYEKVVLDKNNSEKVHQSMKSRIESDPRVLELMEILGIKIGN